jgi:hypothetical protein
MKLYGKEAMLVVFVLVVFHRLVVWYGTYPTTTSSKIILMHAQNRQRTKPFLSGLLREKLSQKFTRQVQKPRRERASGVSAKQRSFFLLFLPCTQRALCVPHLTTKNQTSTQHSSIIFLEPSLGTAKAKVQTKQEEK